MAIVNHFFAVLFGGPPYLLRIDHAVEAGYDLTVWVVPSGLCGTMMHRSPTKSRV